MKKAFSLLLVIALSAICSTTSAKDNKDGLSDKDRADAVFQRALAADQAGDSKQRDLLLVETLRVDPDHKLARWHSGQVLFNGQWKTVGAISRQVSRDPRWQEYRERVEASVDSLQSHADVARWCRAQKLELEEQWHWFNVLRHDPSNREALGSLGLRPYKGDLLTTEQIAEYEASEEQAKAEFKQYAKLLKTAMREAERTEGTERSAALKQISSICDPAAIQAIVEVVLADAKNEKRVLSKLGEAKGGNLLSQMKLAAVAAISEMPEHEATLRLLEISLYASDSQIRASSARSLSYRTLTDFVPLLMAQLAAPIEHSIAVNRLPNGEITVLEDFYEAGPLAQRKHTLSSSFLTQYVRSAPREIPGVPASGPGQRRRARQIVGVWSDNVRDEQNATVQILSSQQQVEAENAAREERNLRVQEVLKAVSGKDFGTDAVAWWKYWNLHNELNTPEELPTVETTEREEYVQIFTNGGETHSCFVAGTPVWTEAGPMAIEKIKIGDLVLSQDPHTGELGYRPVLNTSVGPPSPTVKLAIADDTIVATRGHRFWLAGKGWQMAKFLKTGDRLVTGSGSIDLHDITKAPDAEAFNLEVGQFHTYFVGNGRVLVHDITCPQPTTNIMPGVSPRADFAPQLAARN